MRWKGRGSRREKGKIKGEKRLALANRPFCVNGRTFPQYLENPLIANEKRYGQILKERNVITIIKTTNLF